MPVKGCSPVGSTHVNLGPKSLNADLQRISPMLEFLGTYTHPNNPRVSAEMKGMPFAWVQSLISSCFWRETPQRTTT